MFFYLIKVIKKFIFIKFRKPKTNAIWITDALSIAMTFVAALLFTVCTKNSAGTFSIGTLTFENAQAGILWGIFVYVVLLAVALIGNILVSKADVTSEDDLEAARLERVRLKEEKAEAERIRKEAERAEAKKRAEAEEAEKIRKAKEALESKKNK